MKAVRRLEAPGFCSPIINFVSHLVTFGLLKTMDVDQEFGAFISLFGAQ